MSGINTLPTELIQIQLSHLDLLESLFLPGEFAPSQDTIALKASLQTQLDAPTVTLPSSATLDCTALVFLEPPPDAQHGTYTLELSISLPLSASDPPPPPLLSVRQPGWLSRASHQILADSLAALPAEDDPTTAVLAALELLRDAGAALVPLVEDTAATAGPAEDECRVWFWLQSLSTREKRDDMVKWAKGFGITGFVMAGKWAPPRLRLPILSGAGDSRACFATTLADNFFSRSVAGKPGLLCCEGTPSDIQSYMNDIKSISWADIPSFQKKVSPVQCNATSPPPSSASSSHPLCSPAQITERYRVPLDASSSPRKFDAMIEITDLISKGGGRQNRGEMGEVRDWLDARGLGEDFALVIGNGSF